MRVLHFVASRAWGGTEKVCVDLCNELAGRCDVTAVVLAGTVFTERFAPAVDVVTVRAGSRRNPLVIGELARVLRDVRPDVVHSHAAKASEMIRWARLLKDVPQVATKHNPRKGRVFERLPVVVAVSPAVARSIRSAGRVEVIPNGVAVEPLPDDIPEPDAFTMVAVGRLHEHKGFDLLLRAAAELPFDWRLRVAGEGPARAELTALIGELELDERVELLGHRDDVPALLAGAHLQVVSSRTEGFSLALVEGLHYARAAVSTRVGIAPDLLPAALLFDAGPTTAELAALHDGLAEVTALFARVREERADDFRLDRAAERHLALYGEVARGR